MKKLSAIILSVLSIMTAFTSCSSDDDTPTVQTNGVSMTVEGSNIINEDDNDGVKVNVLLAFAPNSTQTITLSLSGNDGDIVRLSTSTLTFNAGEKEATFYVLSNNKSSLTVPQVVTVNASFSDANMKLQSDPVKVTINPDADIPTLTNEQLALIEGYKTNLGIDIMPLLGKVNVSTVVKFNETDKDSYNDGKDTRTFTGTTIITLSDKATADKPVLKMTSNPMGLTAFFYEILKEQTVEDDEYFTPTPYGAAVMAAVNFNADSETFNVTLDGITINADGSLDFTETTVDEYDESFTTVPMIYSWSAYDRLKAMADAGEEVEVDNGDAGKEMVSLADILESSNTLEPAYWLYNSSIEEDGWGNDPSDWIEPTGKIDFAKGTMTFTYPWDFQNASGYEQITATYTFTPSK